MDKTPPGNDGNLTTLLILWLKKEMKIAEPIQGMIPLANEIPGGAVFAGNCKLTRTNKRKKGAWGAFVAISKLLG